LYTIGQRRGLGLKENKPLFVTQIIPDENRIVVGDYKDLYKEKINVTRLVLHGKYKLKENQKNLTARLRSSAGFVPVENIENDCVILKDATPWAAAGQHLVLYDGNGDENSVVAGGGIIV
jgi:tRNA-specific 2-thiouridylase